MRRRPIITPARRLRLLTVWMVVTALWSAGALLLAYFDETWTGLQIACLLAIPHAFLLAAVVDWLTTIGDLGMDRR